MDIAEVESKAQEAPNPLALTKEDVELAQIADLKGDVQVRHRRLSQLENYIKRIEDQSNATDRGIAAVLEKGRSSERL